MPVTPPSSVTTPSEFSLFEEIPTVTSASRMKESILEAPAAISVITDKDLENWGIVELPDAFRFMPGMDVIAFDENNFGVSPRGFVEQFTRRQLTLIDGMSVYEPKESGVHWQNLPLILEDIDDIEVVRGPNDTLYGFNAMNGVINIKTKDPRETHGTLLRYRWGSNSRNDVVARYGDGMELWNKKFDYRLTYSRDQSEGYGVDHGRAYPDWHKLNLFNFRSRYELSDQWNLEAWAGINDGSQATSNQISLLGDYFQTTSFDFQQLKLNAEFSDTHNASLRFYRWFLNTDPKFLLGDLPVDDSRQAQYDLELQDSFSWREGKAQTVWGGSVRYNDLRSLEVKPLLPDNTVQPVTDVLLSFFLNQKYLLWENTSTEKKLTLVAGVRGESSQLIPDMEWAPRVSLLYQPKKNHVFRVTYARGFAIPSFSNEYLRALFVVPSLGGTIQILGNRDLKREEVNAIETGYSTQLWDGRLTFDADAFISRYTGLLELKTTTSPLVSALLNPGRATDVGVELNAEWKANEWIRIFANHTYDNARDNGDASISMIRNYTPNNKMNVGIYAEFDKEKTPSLAVLDGVSATLNLHSQAPYSAGGNSSTAYVKGYSRVDTRIAKSFYDDGLNVAFSIQNLGGQDHFESTGARVPKLYYVTVTLHDWPWELGKRKSESPG